MYKLFFYCSIIKSQAVSVFISFCSKFCANFPLCALIFVSVFFAEKKKKKKLAHNQLIVSVDIKHHVYLHFQKICSMLFFHHCRSHTVLTVIPIWFNTMLVVLILCVIRICIHWSLASFFFFFFFFGTAQFGMQLSFTRICHPLVQSRLYSVKYLPRLPHYY